MPSEFLRLLEVVTSMCDHVIEYIEADRVERRLMVETLTQLGHVITEGAATAIAAAAVAPSIGRALDAPTAESFEAHERVIGGSMPAGPETGPRPTRSGTRSGREPWKPGASAMEIAVEVRGRFGDRWVDGFEICEVMTTPDGPRYRLRRNRDGVVLPELFDATSIRHVETFDQLKGDQLDTGQRSRAARRRPGRRRSAQRLGGLLVSFLSTRSEPVVETGAKPSATARCQTWNGAWPPVGRVLEHVVDREHAARRRRAAPRVA